jgi:hypothetical protein
MNRYVITIVVDADADVEKVREVASKMRAYMSATLEDSGAKLGFQSVGTKDTGEAPDMSNYSW